MRFALVLSIVCFALPAAAQNGTLQVRVTDSAGRPIDGTVTLTGPGGRRSCRTRGGRCTVPLPAGSWTASLTPIREQAPPPSRVSVFPNRTAVLTLRTRPSTVANTTRVTGTQATVSRRRAPNTPVVTTGTQTGAVTTRRGTTTTTTQTGTTTTTTRRTGTVTRRANTTQTQPRVIQTNPAVQQRTPTATHQGTTPRAVTTTTTRNLGQGNRRCATGSVVDSAGRPTDATLTVSQNGRVLGSVRSVASRFSLFDLPPGRYEVQATPVRGGPAVRMVLSIGNAVARWTIRTR